MSDKILLVTDTHLGIYQSSDMYHEIVLNLFKEIVEYCKTNNIKTVFHLGDFFHEKKSLNTKTQYVAHQIANLFDSALHLHIIKGNHDIYYKDALTPSSLDIFKEHPSIKIIHEPWNYNDKIVLCPWGTIPENFVGFNFIFGHFAFNGFKMNNYYVCENGKDPNDIMWKKFDHVYSGHFHLRSTNGNITYLGSGYPQNFNDVGDLRGYYVWDNGDLEFIEYKSAPKFIKLRTGESYKRADIKNNIVKLIFTEDYGSVKNQQEIDNVFRFSPAKLDPDFSQIKIEGTEDMISVDASLLDTDDIIKEYIDKTELPEHIQKKTLIKMMLELKDGV